jgi:transcriptional regulator with XRE-family HTH domain
VVRSRSKPKPPPEEPEPPVEEPVHEGPIDVNAVVSYNLKAIRERRGWTQQQVADRLARITGHRLPQASISAMERGFDGERRRRFDAHELYLLSVVFDVPIAYFFLPPPGVMGTALADTGAVAVTLYTAILGDEDQLQTVDERLEQLGLNVPGDLDPVMATILGADPSSMNWHDHFRTWRKNRIAVLAREYGDQLDEVADVLAEFAAQIKTFGPQGYLQATAHRKGETPYIPPESPRQLTDLEAAEQVAGILRRHVENEPESADRQAAGEDTVDRGDEERGHTA